jgi:hypothetical protein
VVDGAGPRPAARPTDRDLDRVAGRVRELLAGYAPPDFAHVPSADAALFLCAIDSRTGYREAHRVGGRGPFEGSALLWELGVRAERRRPGLLSAASLRAIDAERVAELFRVDGETVADPGERARLWRDAAARLLAEHSGSARALIADAGGRLGGPGGLLDLLAPIEAFADPLAKKSFLFAKICERRGWLEVADPGSWQVCADNVLMRLSLRSGLVAPGPRERVRAETRDALAALAERAGVSPPILDDLLWELGRDDPDLLGTEGGRVWEPERDPRSHWY